MTNAVTEEGSLGDVTEVCRLLPGSLRLSSALPDLPGADRPWLTHARTTRVHVLWGPAGGGAARRCTLSQLRRSRVSTKPLCRPRVPRRPCAARVPRRPCTARVPAC